MPFHHVAIAARDLDATHRFYSGAMGFELVNVDVIPYLEQGWARHLFYDTGSGGMLAIWDLHGAEVPDFDPALSTGLGLPNFVNHLAFDAPSLEALDGCRDRWLAHGHDVVRVDHGWCVSIYTDDPGGTMVEFCCTTRRFDDRDRETALRRLAAVEPEVDRTEPPIDFYVAAGVDQPV
jgi:catechol 2,3-dioxygenase-like lactoylglutathione lyase family enzyme